MKKLLLVIAMVAIGFTANAQDVKFGAKAGLNISNVRVSGDGITDEMKPDSKISFFVGGMAEVKLSDNFAIQPELLYSDQGSSRKVGKSTSSINLGYLNLPIMAKYFVAEGFALEAGPQVGFLLSANAKTELDGKSVGDALDIKKVYKTVDFGLGFGASYTLDFGLNIGARYNLGLTDLAKERVELDKTTMKNGVIQVSVGYFF